MSISMNLNCPACGGAIGVGDGIKTTNCPYCDTLLWIEGEDGVVSVMFRNKLTRDFAYGVTTDWFRRGWKARDLKELGQITEMYPIYVPFWRLIARAAGWVCGYREETRRDSQGRTYTERIPMERMVFRDFDWSRVACDPGDIGVSSLRNFTGEVLPHDDGTIPTFEPTTSKTDALYEGSEKIRELAIASAGVPHITYQKMHVIPKNLGIIHYPLWIVRYKYLDRTYFATLDGVTNRVIAGRAPGDPLYQGLAISAGTLVGGVVAGAGLVVALENAIGILGVLFGIALTYLAYRFFRYGHEITEGDIKPLYKVDKDFLSSLGINIDQIKQFSRGV
ncbi:MAG: hypothetical protein AB1779_07615 [Candidatus Thermoplasmatota archaeon]